MAWTVSKYEDTQPIGLLKLKLTQETFDPTHDNEELMLANYYDSPILPETPDTSETKSDASIIYNGTTPTIKIGGSYKIFTPVFKDPSVLPQSWLISDENGAITEDMEDYTIEYDNNKLKLKIARKYDLIGSVLIVQVIGADGSTAECRIEVVG